MSHSLFPKITLPTRLAHDSATLIDNLFGKLNKPTHLTTAGILLNKLSDHQPCFILLDTDFVHHKHSKFIKIYEQNDEVQGSPLTLKDGSPPGSQHKICRSPAKNLGALFFAVY